MRRALKTELSAISRRIAALTMPSERLDPLALMGQAGLSPDAWQRDCIQSQHRRLLLNCCRQSGKSSVAAVLALDEALSRSPALILLLSPSLRQSQELFLKVVSLYRLVSQSFPAVHESALRLELANGSRIVSLPGIEQTVRGYSGVRLLVIDEASRVVDPLYYSVRPMISVSGGRLVCLSTPFGKRGFFHQEWTEGEGWEKIKITAHDCPRISPAFLAEEQRAMPAMWFAAEYLCEFTETVDQVFSYDDVTNALSAEVLPLFDVPASTEHAALSNGVTPLFSEDV